MMKHFATVCSGIGAPEVAAESLGWRSVFGADIDPFANAVRAHHWPAVRNYGDMTNYEEWPRHSIDVLIAGTPCQAFSVAGLRKGLADARGNLTLTFLGIVDRYRPRWVLWENVPGVLSIDGGRTFGTFLGGLGQLGYGTAYRILDAQYFGVAQRRRRVFVVGHLGGCWQRAAAVLFERESLRGDPAPCRAARERVAPTVETRSGRSGETTFHTSGGLVEVAPTISARTKGGGGLGTDFDCDGGLISTPCGGPPTADGFEAIPIQEIGKRQSGTPMNGVGHGEPGDPMYTLQSGAQHGVCATLTKNYATHHGRQAGNNGGIAENQLIPVGINGSQIGYALRANASHSGDKGDGGVNTTFCVMAHGQGNAEHVSDGSPSLTCNHEAPILFSPAYAVRRLTPRECERLQGFPDDFTAIEYRGKPAADGPRYKVLGNSMAVPCIRWIFRRIELVDKILEENERR